MHDRGLPADVVTLLARRQALRLLAGSGLIALVGCSDDESTAGSSSTATMQGSSSSSSATTESSTATSAASGAETGCDTIPAETAGPFPGNGTNGPNVLADSGVVRSDITSSLGSGGGVAGGVPLAVELTVVDSGAGCAPLAGAAVYVWHCDREGRYSMYSDGVTDETYLRGVQATGADGVVRFASIFPGAYPGRWPHIHFEVYESLASATSGGTPIAVSQLALPEAICAEVYAESGYEASVPTLAGMSLESDGIFADGSSQQLAAMAGAFASGLTASLSVPVRA
jgi:protocatechuate 3,4-dioxygenase beta subunit